MEDYKILKQKRKTINSYLLLYKGERFGIEEIDDGTYLKYNIELLESSKLYCEVLRIALKEFSDDTIKESPPKKP